MSSPLDIIGRLASVRGLPDLVRASGRVRALGTAGSGTALLAAWLAGGVRTPALVVCAGAEEAEEFAEDLNVFADGLACSFPALEVLPGDVEEPNEAIVCARLAVLRFLATGRAEQQTAETEASLYAAPTAATRLVVTSAAALLQPTRSREQLQAGTLALAVGDETGPGALVEWLVDRGYTNSLQVRLNGEYCLRGGILDVYSHGALEPVRVEFFGDAVDSIRTFDPTTQLSTGRVERCQLTSAGPDGNPSSAERGSLLDYLASDAAALLVEPERIGERLRAVYEQADRSRLLRAPGEAEALLSGRPQVAFQAEAAEAPAGWADAPAVEVAVQQRDTFGPDLDSTLAELGRICTEYGTTLVYCISPAEADRFRALLRGSGFAHLEKLEFAVGRLNHGALCAEAGLALVPHHRLFGRYRQRRFLRHGHEGRPLESVQELEPDDLVVHVEHGIGRFLGTCYLDGDGGRREHLTLEFADGVHVHVPCDRIEMVHRYIGIAGRKPELSAVRSASWRRARQRVEEAVEDLAAELLEIQALRETQAGIAAPGDTEWMRQFESEFQYEETEDQLRAIADLKRDMEAPRPMDRLLCGDVGYGKTEVAMRAAFKTVMGERQVAVLVPTTILAQQHYRTFSERVADYPIRVEMLSRFLTDGQARHVLEGMASGAVDIVIGTHRLLQKGVKFKDLGLVIIDEEQRFGVRHKERLKRLRATVDVLTMTATPIPRTLHMALMGLREISALQTPPVDRQAIQTRVGKFDAELARHAILRELSREGQVFIIHNRVRTIGQFADVVRGLVPEARVAIAHGQMPEHELADTMSRFTNGEVDVLVSTTIIENGMDIPNANTIIIDRAELLGLSEMHQLRGRVGRYVHKAYAYFFTPRDRPVTPEVQRRLDTVRRYSQLGAGFDIALVDLEIRGAGNILGPAQSGHIAAVGYNLYCRLLTRAAARLRGEPVKEPPAVTLDIGLEAMLPEDYVPTPRERMELYRALHQGLTADDVRRVGEGIRDRYGPPPREAQNLLLETELRVLAQDAGIDSIRLEGGRIHLSIRDLELFQERFKGRERRPRVVGPDLAVVDGGFPRDNPPMLAVFLRRLLA